MNQKVLLADDSLTIQKVIKITLANQPYDITDCSSEDELFQKLSQVQPRLVFLDFNLSEKFTGYELTSKIKSISPSTKVLLLLGTFDTVDDTAMEKCGASDKIVKPFDSNKFISICKHLIESSGTEEIPYPKEQKEISDIYPLDQHLDDQWQVNHSTEQKFTAPTPSIQEPILQALNPLDREISDWGMSVPGVIDDKTAHDIMIDLPPVIGEVKSLGDHRLKIDSAKEETKYPDNNDLDYPTIEEMSQITSSSAEDKSGAKLLSIDNFNDIDSLDFKIEHEINSMNDTDVNSIKAQIQDEVEDNLWQVDEFEDLKKEVSSKIENASKSKSFQPTLHDFDESLLKPIETEDQIDWSAMKNDFKQTQTSHTENSTAINLDRIKEELRLEIDNMIKTHVKEYMDQMFQKNVEKISWEVIPDLAENLIRQELSKISGKILNE